MNNNEKEPLTKQEKMKKLNEKLNSLMSKKGINLADSLQKNSKAEPTKQSTEKQKEEIPEEEDQKKEKKVAKTKLIKKV